MRTLEDKHFGLLIIQDNGRGMSPDVVDKVFVPFYTTKIGGTGLGMVFVRQIVDEHRGVITLDSKVGRGPRSPSACPCASPKPRGSRSRPRLPTPRPGPMRDNRSN